MFPNNDSLDAIYFSTLNIFSIHATWYASSSHHLCFSQTCTYANKLKELDWWNCPCTSRYFTPRLHDLRLHPEPIFVLGHPRAGTAHLHNLLTLDKRWVLWLNWMSKTLNSKYSHKAFAVNATIHSTFATSFPHRPQANGLAFLLTISCGLQVHLL